MGPTVAALPERDGRPHQAQYTCPGCRAQLAPARSVVSPTATDAAGTLNQHKRSTGRSGDRVSTVLHHWNPRGTGGAPQGPPVTRILFSPSPRGHKCQLQSPAAA